LQGGGQVGHLPRAFGVKGGHAVQAVLQLADVAGPVVGEERRQKLFAKTERGQTRGMPRVEEVLDEDGGILPSFPALLKKQLKGAPMPAPRAMLELTTARLGADALLIGASELAFAPILQDPTIVPLSGDPDPVDFRRRAGPPLDRWSVAEPAQGGDGRPKFSGQLSLSTV